MAARFWWMLHWNLGEIISAIAGCGLVIEKLVEEPRYDQHKNLPGNFTLVANKYKVDLCCTNSALIPII